jgi:hypothetical protein
MNRRQFLESALAALTVATIGAKVKAQPKPEPKPCGCEGWCLEYIPPPKPHTIHIPVLTNDD